MKIRTRMVSNSSSSSFAVKQCRFNGIIDLAAQMVRCRGYDNDEELATKILSLDIPLGRGISFHSCNYDTYIVPLGDSFVVSTCNNHDWDAMGSWAEWPQEVYELAITDDLDNDIRHWVEYYMPRKLLCYITDYDIYGYKADFGQWCRKCNCDVVDTYGKLLCRCGES